MPITKPLTCIDDPSASQSSIVEQQMTDQEQIDLQHHAVVSELQKLLELLRVGRKDVDAWTDLIRLFFQSLLLVKSSRGRFSRLVHTFLHVENLISQEAKSRRAIRKEKQKCQPAK